MKHRRTLSVGQNENKGKESNSSLQRASPSELTAHDSTLLKKMGPA